MKEIVQFIEFVGFDILLTGVLVILAIGLSTAIANSDDFADGVKMGLESMVDRWNGLPVAGAVAVFIAASFFGHVFILVGDAWREGWKEEDSLKTDAVSDAWKRIAVRAPLKALLRSHGAAGDCEKGEDGCKPCSPDKQEHCAKGLFQHAKAVIGDKGSARSHERLRRERYATEIFSVLFVVLVSLFLATLIGPVGRRVASILIPKDASGDPADAEFPSAPETLTKLKGIWRGIAWAIVLWFTIGLNLRLWSEQAMRYNRKLIHTYVMLASQGDPAIPISSAKANAHPEGG